MTKEEFLVKVGLHEEDFRDFVRKFADFEESLNPAQQAALRRSLHSHSEALRSLGDDLTSRGLNKILKEIGAAGEDPDHGDGGQFSGRGILGGKVNARKPKSEG